LKHLVPAIIGIAMVSTLAVADTAHSCSVYPEPGVTRAQGESVDAFLARQQRQNEERAEQARQQFAQRQQTLLRDSPVVLVARVTNVRSAIVGSGVRLRLLPVRSIRGQPSLRPVWVDYPEPVHCGRERGGDLALVTEASSQPIIIFANNAVLARETILDSFTASERNIPQIQAALMAR
jgi:hypothetical protein